VLEKISRTHDPDTVLSATAKLVITSPEGRVARTVAMAIKRPSSLRIEALPVFGTPDLLLCANRHYLKVFLPQEREYYIGPPTGKNIFLFSRLYFDIGDAVSILTGTLPTVTREDIHVKGSRDDNLYRIDVSADEKILQTVWVEPRDFAIVRLNSYDNEGTLLYHVTFDNYVAINDSSYPRQIVITSSVPQEIRAVIKIARISVASDTGETLFDLPVPPGITPRYLE
jgi:outer membrane lipoprotein-sorting protein